LSTDVCSWMLINATNFTVDKTVLIAEVGGNGDGESVGMEAKKRAFDRHREAATPHVLLGADQCPQTLVQGTIGVARLKALLYSTQMTVKAMAWAASRCLASLVMKGIVSPEAV
jgi:hypothetical protein